VARAGEVVEGEGARKLDQRPGDRRDGDPPYVTISTVLDRRVVTPGTRFWLRVVTSGRGSGPRMSL
jgi:hypothetical protein